MPGVREILREGFLISVAGVLAGLAGNALSPRGLSLTRDYFPAQSKFSPASVPTLVPNQTEPNIASEMESGAAQDRLQARFAQRGLQLASHDQVAVLFQDARYAQGLIVFVDARDEPHYQAGHIPAAYPFDHYRLADYIQAVLPVCLVAEQIVVYCNGGDCEDSAFAAGDLVDLGVPREKIVVYGGGLAEWKKQRMAVEAGLRGSGSLIKSDAK